jgi:hypothetical protein
VQAQRAVAGVAQSQARAIGQAARVAAGGAVELMGAQVVMGQHLGAIGRPLAAERLEPFRGAQVHVAAPPARDLAVGNVADEDMLEAKLGLAPHRGLARAAEELAVLERSQAPHDDAPRLPGHRAQRSRPDDPADDSAGVQQRLLLGGERVQPRRDDASHRLRDRQRLEPDRRRVGLR